MNVQSKQAVRVVRGPNGDSKYAPKDGYRYDGLYKVEKVSGDVDRFQCRGDLAPGVLGQRQERQADLSVRTQGQYLPSLS